MTPAASLTLTAAVSMIGCCSPAYAPSAERITILSPYNTVTHGPNRPEFPVHPGADFRVQPIITTIHITTEHDCAEPTYITQQVDYTSMAEAERVVQTCQLQSTVQVSGRYELREATRNQLIHHGEIFGAATQKQEFSRYADPDELPSETDHHLSTLSESMQNQIMHSAYQDFMRQMYVSIRSYIDQHDKR